jgi:hypothetical protein
MSRPRKAYTTPVLYPLRSQRNYLLCAPAGTASYFQFFFYTMGESQMGAYAFSASHF